MICPRCSVAEISAETHQCVLCGYAPGGVIIDAAPRDELDDAARRELAPQFQIGALLAQNARSSVYVARETDSERRVALRVLARRPVKDAGLEDRFQREFASAASLDHPHVIPIHRFGSTTTLLWCSMKFVEGRSLAAILRDHGPLELGACLRLLEQVASALQYAHRRGVVHGDVRPANVLVDDAEWALLGDFALGRVLDLVPAPGGAPARPVEFVAPEESVSRHAAPAADQYALAVTLWECLTGKTPPRQALPPRIADVRGDLPSLVSDVLARALAPQPAERFPTVLEFVSALSAGPPHVLAPPTTPRPTPPRQSARASNRQVLLVDNPMRGRRWLAFGLVAAMVIGAGAVVVPLLKTAPPPAAGPVAQGPAPVVEPPRPARPPADSIAPRPGPTAPPRAAPTPAPIENPGRLFVSATPWGQLYVDDELIGNTPRANVPVTPGSRRIRVVRDGFRAYDTRIQVAPGQEIRLTDIVLQAQQP